MQIEKKVLACYFEKILSGEKTFELRLADFACAAGDTLLLREWDPERKAYTGRSLSKQITYVLKTKDVSFWDAEAVAQYGYQILALR